MLRYLCVCLCGWTTSSPSNPDPQPLPPPSPFITHTNSRLVAIIASFGALKPKAAFRFVARACPGYATGPFLAHLKDAGAYLFVGCSMSSLGTGAYVNV